LWHQCHGAYEPLPVLLGFLVLNMCKDPVHF
jgi:hypothetical protein